MFLELSLTTWLVIVGVFVIITPIIGKQTAKDALKVKDSLSNPYNSGVILFPNEYFGNLQKVGAEAPVQSLTEEKYIRRMMMGGVWVKFVFNISTSIFTSFMIVFMSILYPIGAFFYGIFSTK